MLMQRFLQSSAAAVLLAAACTKAMDRNDARSFTYHPDDGIVPAYHFFPVTDRMSQGRQGHLLSPVQYSAAHQDNTSPLSSPDSSSSVDSRPPLSDLPSGSQQESVRQAVISPLMWPEELQAVNTATQLRPGSSRQIESRIPAFENREGQHWGPFELHPSAFQPVPYPLDMAELSHLYAPDPTTEPADFEQIVGGRHAARKTGIKVSPLTYRPEPELLHKIRDTFVTSLAQHVDLLQRGGLAPGDVYYARFMWPPLETTSSGLQMPKGFLDRLVALPRERLRDRNQKAGNLYQMVISTSQGKRNILMTSGKMNRWTTLDGDWSDFWIFYEGRRSVDTRQNSLSFLGGMLLPKNAQHYLLQSGVMSRYLA